MEIPSIKILSRDLVLLNEIDLYTSFDFLRSWQGIGDFTLKVCKGSSGLKRGNIIMLGDDGHRCGIIENVVGVHDENGVDITVTGKTLNSLTKQRVVLPSENEADGGYFCIPAANDSVSMTAAENIIKTFASYCFGENAETARQFPNLIITTNQGRGIETNWMSRYNELSSELESICQYCDCGYEIYIDLESRKFVFEYREGIDRSSEQTENSRVIFSVDFESVDSVTYTEDYSNYKNVAYCGGKGEGADRIIKKVRSKGTNTEAEGFERFEIFVDCGSLESIETDTALSLEQEGQRKLEDYAASETLSSEISAFGSFRYLEHWDLGDLVTAVDDELNIMQDKRITEVRESYEPESIKISATLGDVPKRLGKVLKSLKGPVK